MTRPQRPWTDPTEDTTLARLWMQEPQLSTREIAEKMERTKNAMPRPCAPSRAATTPFADQGRRAASVACCACGGGGVYVAETAE